MNCLITKNTSKNFALLLSVFIGWGMSTTSAYAQAATADIKIDGAALERSPKALLVTPSNKKTPSQVVHNAPESIEPTMNENELDLLSEMAWRLLSDIAVKLFSGNEAELLSGNSPNLLSGNEAELLSGNAPNLLSGNEAELLSRNSSEIFSGNEATLFSGNEAEILSGNQVPMFSNNTITINISNSGNQGERKQTKNESKSKKKTSFRSQDINGDGKLTFAEFANAGIAKKQKKIRRRFRKLDLNTDGLVSKNEFQIIAQNKTAKPATKTQYVSLTGRTKQLLLLLSRSGMLTER